MRLESYILKGRTNHKLNEDGISRYIAEDGILKTSIGMQHCRIYRKLELAMMSFFFALLIGQQYMRVFIPFSDLVSRRMCGSLMRAETIMFY